MIKNIRLKVFRIKETLMTFISYNNKYYKILNNYEITEIHVNLTIVI